MMAFLVLTEKKGFKWYVLKLKKNGKLYTEWGKNNNIDGFAESEGTNYNKKLCERIQKGYVLSDPKLVLSNELYNHIVDLARF